MPNTKVQNLMRRYLLGALPAEERTRLEDRYLVDVDVFETLVAVENDLIDAYVRGELTGDERVRFEAEYLASPARRDKVNFARALSVVSASARQSIPIQAVSPWKRLGEVFSRSWGIPQWAFAAAVVAIVAAGSWLTVQNLSLRAGLRQAQARQAEQQRAQDELRRQNAQLAAVAREPIQENQQNTQVAQLEVPPAPGLTFRLNSGTARGVGEQQETLVVPSGASRVRLQLILDRNEYKAYEAVLQTAEGSEILRAADLHSRSTREGAVVAWRLPARSLPAGDYVIQLSGRLASGSLEDVDSFSFRVEIE
jgi:hypothetical protein